MVIEVRVMTLYTTNLNLMCRTIYCYIVYRYMHDDLFTITYHMNYCIIDQIFNERSLQRDNFAR